MSDYLSQLLARSTGLAPIQPRPVSRFEPASPAAPGLSTLGERQNAGLEGEIPENLEAPSPRRKAHPENRNSLPRLGSAAPGQVSTPRPAPFERVAPEGGNLTFQPSAGQEPHRQAQKRGANLPGGLGAEERAAGERAVRMHKLAEEQKAQRPNSPHPTVQVGRLQEIPAVPDPRHAREPRPGELLTQLVSYRSGEQSLAAARQVSRSGEAEKAAPMHEPAAGPLELSPAPQAAARAAAFEALGALLAAQPRRPGPARENPALHQAAPPETIVQVTIGRIDIRAVPPVPAAAPAQKRSAGQAPTLSLDEYLRLRSKGGG